MTRGTQNCFWYILTSPLDMATQILTTFGSCFLFRYLLRRLLQHQAMDSSRQQLAAPAVQVHVPSQVSSQVVPMSPAPAPRQSTQSIAQLLGEVEKRRKKTNRKKKAPAEENASKGYMRRFCSETQSYEIIMPSASIAVSIVHRPGVFWSVCWSVCLSVMCRPQDKQLSLFFCLRANAFFDYRYCLLSCLFYCPLEACMLRASGDTGTLWAPWGHHGYWYGAYGGSTDSSTELHKETASRGTPRRHAA